MDFKDWFDVVVNEEAVPNCPKCNAPMVLRANRSTGEQFYGCPNYPNCKGSRTYSPPAAQQTPPPQQQPRQQRPQQKGRSWVYAKVTKKGDKRFPNLGAELAVSQRSDQNWDYIVLANPQDRGTIYNNEISSGLIQSLKNIKTNQPLRSQNPSLEDLEQQFAKMGMSSDDARPEEMPSEEPENQPQSKKLIPPNLISREQSQIDERFGNIIQSEEQQHIMINALAGTGKTTMLKHLAWKYGKPGQKWLYIVFNTKNKVEAAEEFPSFVDVRTSNGFLGEVLQMPQNVNNIGHTDRMANIWNQRKSGGKKDKSRIVADSPLFNNVINQMGIPEKVDTYEYGKIGKTLNSLVTGIRYNYKEAVLQLTGLGKSFALNPSNQQALVDGLNKILGSYDVDTDLIQIKERIAGYGPDFRNSVEHYLEEILGYDFMSKSFEKEILQGTIWMMQKLMPNAIQLKDGDGRLAVDLASYRDFDDDLWYTATHADQLIWPKYNIVLADEVQDFNECQKIMLNKLHEAGAKIVAVGDPNQAIYRFRGADGQAFNNLGNMLGGLSQGDAQVTYNLTQNFRSRPEILEFANEETHVNDLKAGRKFEDGKKGVVTKFEKNYDDEFDNLANEVKQAGGKVPQQTAFISRTNEPLVKTALKLLANNIPFIIVGKDIAKALLDHIRTISNIKRLGDRDSTRTLAADLSEFLDSEKDKHYGKSTKKAYLQETEETTNALLASIQAFEAEVGDYTTIGSFKKWISARLGGLEVEENEKDLRKYKKMIKEQNPVILTTAHKSKGLEFSRVYVLRYDNFPHPKAEREEDLQQEENMKYVTLTRAKDEIHVLELDGQPGYNKRD